FKVDNIHTLEHAEVEVVLELGGVSFEDRPRDLLDRVLVTIGHPELEGAQPEQVGLGDGVLLKIPILDKSRNQTVDSALAQPRKAGNLTHPELTLLDDKDAQDIQSTLERFGG